MTKLWKKSLLAFMRSRSLGIPYLVLLVFLLGLFAFCFNNYLRYSQIFSVMVWLARPAIFIIVFFIYFGYEITIKIHDNNVAEYAGACKHGLLKAYAAIALSLLTIVAVPAAMFFAFILFMYRYANIQYLPFQLHLAKLSLLYFGISFAIGVILGMAMASKLKANRLAAYSLTIVFMLINTTFTDAIFRTPYLLFNSYSGERILYGIKDFLTVVPYQLGSSFRVEPIYGFPAEPIRWILAAFWVVFPLVLILAECFGRKIKRSLQLVGCLIVLAGIFLFSGRGSIWVMDMRIDSYAYGDPFYCMYIDRSREEYEKCEAGFAVERYEMDLTIGNALHAEVEVTVDNRELESYEFTLYRGYILKDVRTECGRIPFIRKGDHISVGKLNGEKKIIFVYDGKSPKYCANKQAITLPGYFAYYPKAGKRNIFDVKRYGYVINLSPNESQYVVKVRSGLKVFSNLPGNDNAFHGKSNGLSLFAGMYDEVDEGMFAEPMREDLPKRSSVREAEEVLKAQFRRLDRPIPKSWAHFSEKKFFQVPESFHINSDTEDCVIASDHVLVVHCYGGQQLAEASIGSIIKRKTGEDWWVSRFRWSYSAYLFNRQDETDPVFKSPVDLDLLLEQIEECLSITKKLANIPRERILKMTETEKKIYEADKKQQRELIDEAEKKATKYVFYESPRKEENMRIFFDYFTSSSSEDPFRLVERIVREEKQRAGS